MKKLLLRIVLRIVLSPFVFLYGALLCYGGIIFPTTIITFYGLMGMVYTPFCYLFKASGSDVVYIEPMFQVTNYIFVNHFLCFTIILWVPFYITYRYIKTSKIIL